MNFEDLIYASMGGVLIAKEKIENIINKMIEQGQLTKQEGENFLNELINKAKEEQENLVNKTKTEIETFLKKHGCITKEEFLQLENRVLQLEKRLNK